MPTHQIVENFFVKPRIQKIYDEPKLIDAIRKIEENRCLPSEKETKSRAIKYAVGEWFSQKMREKYQELSPEIFELKRTVGLDPDKFRDHHGNKLEGKEEISLISLEIPMFAEAELGKETEWKKDVKYTTGGKYNTHEYLVYLCSKMPYIPLNIRQTRKEALSLVYNTYAEALNTEILSDVILENPDYAPKPEESELVVAWKPNLSEILVEVKRIDKDPALILKNGKPFLVETWTAPEEEPFRDILSACKISDLSNFFSK